MRQAREVGRSITPGGMSAILAFATAALDNLPPDDGAVKPGGSTKPHRIYNIGSNRSEHLMKVIGLIEAECGRSAEKIMLPMQPGDVPSTYVDIAAIAQDLGYAPTIPIEVGVPAFVRWYREYHGF